MSAFDGFELVDIIESSVVGQLGEFQKRERVLITNIPATVYVN